MSKPITFEFIARVKAFSGEKVCKNKIQIHAGVIRVWDDVAGHYTRCHNIDPVAQLSLLRRAAGIASTGVDLEA